MKKINIVGAGMAGLLAANMLRSKADVRVFEKASSLPNNHHAVLRFRSDVVAQATGIKFRKVRMIRTSIGTGNEVADSLSYAMKCNGRYTSDRSITSGTVVGDRFIAPRGFISQLYTPLCDRVAFHVDAFENFDSSPTFPIIEQNRDVTISTIPMPSLMKALGYKSDIEFNYSHGCVLTASIDQCDAFVSVYNADPSTDWSRASITGSDLLVEFPRKDIDEFFGWLSSDQGMEDVLEILSALGIKQHSLIKSTVRIKEQQYSKILPIDDEERLSFIHWATDRFGIYSLGRFATWRPNVLLDDLVNDIGLIDRWTDRKSRYAVSAHR